MTPSSLADSISDQNVFQNAYYIAINIENILYGIELLLYFKTIQILLTRNKGARTKSDIFYALFSSIMMFSVTVWVATSAIFGQEMWLLQDNYPGDPNAYWRKYISIWYMDWAMTSVILLQLMTDALMIYRCWIIWNSYRAIVIPVILWLSTLVLGIVVDWTSSSPGGDFFTGIAAQLGLSYYAVSVFLNTTLTCMICYYMLRHGKRVEKGLGREYASSYFTVVTIVIESVIPYTLSGIAFLVSLGMGSSTSVAFVSVYFLMMCISPQMLILRVLMGAALDRDTCKPSSSTLKFSHGGTSGSPWIDSSGTETRLQLQILPNAYLPDGRDGKVSTSQV